MARVGGALVRRALSSASAQRRSYSIYEDFDVFAGAAEDRVRIEGITNRKVHELLVDKLMNKKRFGGSTFTGPCCSRRQRRYDDTGFTANGVKYEGSLICLGKLAFTWTPKTLAEITPESLAIFQLLRPAPEILVMGCGKTIGQINPNARAYLRSNGIKLEVIDTRNAASTFNILNEEGRQVAAAMLPHGSVS